MKQFDVLVAAIQESRKMAPEKATLSAKRIIRNVIDELATKSAVNGHNELINSMRQAYDHDNLEMAIKHIQSFCEAKNPEHGDEIAEKLFDIFIQKITDPKRLSLLTT